MAERMLWQHVVFQAFIDATWALPAGTNGEARVNQAQADAWIRGCGKSFRRVCAYADLDPEFLSRAYVQGRVDPARLRAATISTGRILT